MLKYLSRNKIRRANVVIALMLILSMVLPFVPAHFVEAAAPYFFEIGSDLVDPNSFSEGSDSANVLKLNNGAEVSVALKNDNSPVPFVRSNGHIEAQIEAGQSVYVKVVAPDEQTPVSISLPDGYTPSKDASSIGTTYVFEINAQADGSHNMLNVQVGNQNPPTGNSAPMEIRAEEVDSIDEAGCVTLKNGIKIKNRTTPFAYNNGHYETAHIQGEPQTIEVVVPEGEKLDKLEIDSFIFTERDAKEESSGNTYVFNYQPPQGLPNVINVKASTKIASVITIGNTVVVDESSEHPVKENTGYVVNYNEKENAYEIEIGKAGNASIDAIKSTGSANVSIILKDSSYADENITEVEIGNPNSPYAIDIQGELYVCGDWDTLLRLNGGINASNVWIRDIAHVDLGGDPDANNVLGINANGGNIIFDKTEAFIMPKNNPAFMNANMVRANSGASVFVWGDGDNYHELDHVNSIKVYEGGMLDISAPVIDNVLAFAYKLNEAGQILDVTEGIDDHGTELECKVGNFAGKDRYVYKKEEGHVRLESTAGSLCPLSFQTTDPTRDDYVGNGTFIVEASSGIRRWNKAHTEYDYEFEKGVEVKFTLVPDAGYQYKPGTFDFNGGDGTGEATDDPGVYIYHMGDRPVHVTCLFEKANDTIVNDSKAISGVAITVPEGTIANGTAEFDVKDATLTAAQKESFAKVAGELEVAQTLDLKFGQKIDKIDAEGSWNIPITDLEKPMEISLKLGEKETYEDYAVIREHNGKVEVLESKYDEKTNTITFKTNGYSTYAIAHTAPKKAPAGPKPDNKPAPQNNTPSGSDNSGNNAGTTNGVKSPNTGESNLPFVLFASSMLAVVAAGIVYSLRRKQGN